VAGDLRWATQHALGALAGPVRRHASDFTAHQLTVVAVSYEKVRLGTRVDGFIASWVYL